MAAAPQTLEGWYALHDFRKVHWQGWRDVDDATRRAVIQEVERDFFEPMEKNEASQGFSAWFAIGGQKADLLFLHLRPTLDDLFQIELTFNRTRLADYTTQPFSFISITEIGYYTGGSENQTDFNPRRQAFIQRRLYPQKPDSRYLSFYPMNKRREAVNNWYTLPTEAREQLMYEHALIGRRHSGDVQQMITGAIGFDDWEWGVTLHSNNPLSLKKVIQEMRFEEASAKYADFGPSFVGRQLNREELFDFLAGRLANSF